MRVTKRRAVRLPAVGARQRRNLYHKRYSSARKNVCERGMFQSLRRAVCVCAWCVPRKVRQRVNGNAKRRHHAKTNPGKPRTNVLVRYRQQEPRVRRQNRSPIETACANLVFQNMTP